MKKIWLVSFLGALLFTFARFQPVQADGIIIPPPPPPCDPGPCPTAVPGPRPYPLQVKYHHVDVTITDQVAETHVDQVFYNPTDTAVEGTYMFPLPLDAAVSDFTLWVDGKAVPGKVLDAQTARGVYEDIVRRQLDPALLEYAGRGAVQASIFPIPPRGERRIELSYSQALTADNGLVRYIYPLNTEKFSNGPLENVAVRVEISGRSPIRAVYSPSHKVDVRRQGDTAASASYEENNVKPDTDFTLVYSIGEAEAFHILTYRDPSDPLDPDGYFLALLAPRPGAAEVKVAKDLILVLDRSGSMDGEKINQAKSAAAYILEHLNPEDRFQVITFSSDLDRFSANLLPASAAGDAVRWVDGIGASGSTDINRALLEAAGIADRERPTYLIFLTDGLPTEGVQDTQSILDNFAAAAGGNLRLFSFGVGYDVDTQLLDTLSQDAHGRSTYVREGQALDEILSGFYAGISTPVLTNLKLAFTGVSVRDVYPAPLPDLFEGSQVLVTGRYARGGSGDVTLTGEVNGEEKRFVYEGQTFAVDSRAEDAPVDALPRLWAARKIGSLLTLVRLHGPDPETIGQIVKLSTRFGIVTPYTSYLVTEDAQLGMENQERVAEETYNQLQAMPTQAPYGMDAVQKAAEQGAMSQAQVAPVAPAPQAGSPASGGVPSSGIRYAGSRAFVMKDGRWTDTTYDPQTMTAEKIPFLSPAYFDLAQSGGDVAAALALGERVLLVVDGKAVEIVQAGENVPAPAAPTRSTPTPKAMVPQDSSEEASLPESTPAPVRTAEAAGGGVSPWVWLGGLVVLFVGGGVAAIMIKR